MPSSPGASRIFDLPLSSLPWLALVVLLLLQQCKLALSEETEADPSGYLVYCPCMGRFGNQADHFLGALAFAHAVNRTLVLPPWIEYNPSKLGGSDRVPFKQYFRTKPLQAFHLVITMEDFMRGLAPTLWPEAKRGVVCWGARDGPAKNSCNAKEGNPFGPFWDHFGIDFVSSEFYGPMNLHFDVQRDKSVALGWSKAFPPATFPVLAFAGAPASFPVSERNRHLHKYLKWSKTITSKADAFIRDTLPPGPFVGIHLRNDLDWDNVCKHVESSRQLFASPQCLGYSNEHGLMTFELCMPSKETIIRQVRDAVRVYSAKSVFVAADRDHMIEDLNESLKDLHVSAFRLDPDIAHVSLAILAKSDFYIGNCVSSFSAFAARERHVNGLPSGFWAFKMDALRDKNNVKETVTQKDGLGHRKPKMEKVEL